MQPCDKGPVIDRVLDHLESQGEKLDKINESLAILAVQKDRIDRIGKQTDDHENRLRILEGTPKIILSWIFGIVAIIMGSVIVAKMIGG